MPLNEVIENVWACVTAVLGGSLVLQLSPISINPWSWILKRIGNIMNEDIKKTVDDLSDKVAKLDERATTNEDAREQDKVLDARRRILRFADECIRNERHSREYFDNVLDDITLYEQYCLEHPKFKNEKCVRSIGVVRHAYDHCSSNNDFI